MKKSFERTLPVENKVKRKSQFARTRDAVKRRLGLAVPGIDAAHNEPTTKKYKTSSAKPSHASLAESLREVDARRKINKLITIGVTFAASTALLFTYLTQFGLPAWARDIINGIEDQTPLISPTPIRQVNEVRRTEIPTTAIPPAHPESTEIPQAVEGYVLHEYDPALCSAEGTVRLSYDRQNDPNHIQVLSSTRHLPVKRQFKTESEGTYALKYCLEGERTEDGNYVVNLGVDQWGVGSEAPVVNDDGEVEDAMILLINTNSLYFTFDGTQSTSGTANDYGNPDSLRNEPFAPMVPDFRNLPE
jgi:hypothetical protein